MNKKILFGMISLLILLGLFLPIYPKYIFSSIGNGCPQGDVSNISLFQQIQDRYRGYQGGVLGTSFCIDHQKIYFGTSEIFGSDPSTFKVVTGLNLFATDNNNLYYQKESIYTWSDKDPMGMIKDIGTGCISNDRHIWCGEITLPDSTDISSFAVLSSVYAKDKNAVYYAGNLLSGADTTTFKVLSGGNRELAEDIHNTYKYGIAYPKQ